MSCVFKDFDGICTLMYGDQIQVESLCVDSNDYCVCDETKNCDEECSFYEDEDENNE